VKLADNQNNLSDFSWNFNKIFIFLFFCLIFNFLSARLCPIKTKTSDAEANGTPSPIRRLFFFIKSSLTLFCDKVPGES
ncbi:hypothetical protein, partial [Mediterraneibacter glycyrrhizinilyticus]|uniref:hypothetical protein n=1 Tax=Mediterraneibacter glycyrrhizinilyticus TaxID=342942 RepID=UPI00265ACAEB